MARGRAFRRLHAFSLLWAAGACAPALTPMLPAREVGGLAGARGAPAPGLRVEVQERFYPVSGVTSASLNGALARAGPTVRGRKAQALTEWRLSWTYVPARRGARCASSRPRVDVHIVTILPRWLEHEQASERLAWDWSLFLERLRHHESEHQGIAMRSARQLLDVLHGLTADDCQLLQEMARRVAAGLAYQSEELHARFDRSSDYGVTSFR